MGGSAGAVTLTATGAAEAAGTELAKAESAAAGVAAGAAEENGSGWAEGGKEGDSWISASRWRRRGPEVEFVRRSLMICAMSTSMELEWVFFSLTPNSGSMSRMVFGLTSSSLASSLIRIIC